MITRERMADKQGEEHIGQEQHVPTLPPGSIYSDEEVLVDILAFPLVFLSFWRLRKAL